MHVLNWRTWLAWASRTEGPSGEPIDNPRAYLVRIAVHQALARQAAINRRRETYVGPWLPEPLVAPLADTAAPGDAGDAAVRAEAVSMALLVVLETLTPTERAVSVASVRCCCTVGSSLDANCFSDATRPSSDSCWNSRTAWSWSFTISAM